MGRLVDGRGAHLAPYGHWVGFVRMGGAPRLVDPDTPRAPHFASWGHPHTYKTNPVAIAGCHWAHTTPPAPPYRPYGHRMPPNIQLHAFRSISAILCFTQDFGFLLF